MTNTTRRHLRNTALIATLFLAQWGLMHTPLGRLPEGVEVGWTAVIAAAASLLGNYLNKDKDTTGKSLKQMQLDAIKRLMPYGDKMLQRGTDYTALPASNLMSMAGGDRGEVMQSLSPELGAMAAGNRKSLSAMAELAPRGGASSSFLSRLPFQNNATVSNMMLGSRQNALQQLLSLGQNMQNTGMAAMAGGSGGASNLLNYGLNERKQKFDESSAYGQGIYNIFKGLSDWYSKKTTPNQTWTTNDTTNAANGMSFASQ